MDPKKAALYFPAQESDVPSFLSNVVIKMTTEVKAKYGITAETAAAIAALPKAVGDAIAKAESDKAVAAASTTLKQEAINNARATVSSVFDSIRKNDGFEAADGDAIQIFKSKAAFDPSQGRPVISGLTVGVQEIILDWVKGRFSGVVIYTSADNITWTRLDKDSRSPFEDRRPWTGPEVRYYKMRYLLIDAEVGQESEVLKVVVG